MAGMATSLRLGRFEAYYWFKIEFSSTPGKFNFYLNGTYYNQTVLNHTTYNNPSFNGETTNTCIHMEALAARSISPIRTLQYLTYGSQGAVWSYFSPPNFFSQNPGLYSDTAGDFATCYAYGYATS